MNNSTTEIFYNGLQSPVIFRHFSQQRAGNLSAAGPSVLFFQSFFQVLPSLAPGFPPGKCRSFSFSFTGYARGAIGSWGEVGSAAVVDGGRITPSPVEGFPPPCMVPPGPSQSIEGSCGLVGELTMGALSVSSVEAVGRFPLFAPDVDAAELLSVV